MPRATACRPRRLMEFGHPTLIVIVGVETSVGLRLARSFSARSNWLAIADEAPTFLGLPHSPLINPRLATVRSAQNETEIPFAIEIAT